MVPTTRLKFFAKLIEIADQTPLANGSRGPVKAVAPKYNPLPGHTYPNVHSWLGVFPVFFENKETVLRMVIDSGYNDCDDYNPKTHFRLEDRIRNRILWEESGNLEKADNWENMLRAKMRKLFQATEREIKHRHQRGWTLTQEVGPDCPECGRMMVKRTARRGFNAGNQFWGCTGYPDCKKTFNIDEIASQMDDIEKKLDQLAGRNVAQVVVGPPEQFERRKPKRKVTFQEAVQRRKSKAEWDF